VVFLVVLQNNHIRCFATEQQRYMNTKGVIYPILGIFCFLNSLWNQT